jgi:hypothetical protein
MWESRLLTILWAFTACYTDSFTFFTFRHRWENNIKEDVREIGWDGMDWFDQAQGKYPRRALVNTV